MTTEEDQIIKETLELVKDNNSMLHKMRRAQVVGNTISIIKWVAVIAITLGTYYYLQPMMNQLLEVYSGLGDLYQSTGNVFQGLKQGINLGQ